MKESTPSHTTPLVMLGLDYGVKKMGMALGNTITQDARPFDILAMNNGQPDWDNLLGIIDAWQIGIIVIGLPLNMDGTESMLAKRCAKFARRLAHRLGEQKRFPQIYLSDERLTSREARELCWSLGLIKDHTDPIDDVSACLILNAYFDNPEALIAIDNYHSPKDN